MAKLIGAQKLVLQAIKDLPQDAAGFVTDTQLVQSTNIALNDVRDWIETLEKHGYVDVARTKKGLSASVTAEGRLVLSQFLPFNDEKQVIRTILVLAANPKRTQPLRLDEEVKKIEQGLGRAKRSDQFKLVKKWAVTDDDLRRALMDHKPEIVHFSGRGSGSRELVFENDSGQIRLITGDALFRLFELCSDRVKCVVLNACYSQTQADAIAKHVDYVVGTEKAIGDEAAMKFAFGFYDGLGSDHNFEDAYKQACVAIELANLPYDQTPIFVNRNREALFPNAAEPQPKRMSKNGVLLPKWCYRDNHLGAERHEDAFAFRHQVYQAHRRSALLF